MTLKFWTFADLEWLYVFIHVDLIFQMYGAVNCGAEPVIVWGRDRNNHFGAVLRTDADYTDPDPAMREELRAEPILITEFDLLTAFKDYNITGDLTYDHALSIAIDFSNKATERMARMAERRAASNN